MDRTIDYTWWISLQTKEEERPVPAGFYQLQVESLTEAVPLSREVRVDATAIAPVRIYVPKRIQSKARSTTTTTATLDDSGSNFEDPPLHGLPSLFLSI